ncbi:Acetyltransferase (GNAT) domain-containing protein [Aquipseudomonas alcaligenes]|uniref:GNAT family N-acetyltransferase n=1 Tax=Aquipseudomonas alcaligenes TaxID=43263 RepID=UPI000955913E|nr:GNAT family N-acetyltransferase [Pseudomonas alcaligenes]SIS13288.1 Acetyltransferase (GNAT) domain-containing protein [Pseudomonas alcaligenes]
MISFLPAGSAEQQLLRYSELFSVCFPASPKFSLPALHWLYAQNPDGTVVGFDAFDGDLLVAHYVCIPAAVRLAGRTVRALLSLNTATRPSHQGRGLFSKLAEMTYQAAAEQGYECVYGVANANSTPGFVRKLGFQLVEPLAAKVGLGGLGGDLQGVDRQAQFQRVWSPESLRWRCSNPASRVDGWALGGCHAFHARALSSLVPAYAELSAELPMPTVSPPLTPLRLYIGLRPSGTCRFSSYVDIPDRLRPSPLNLIFRPLSVSDERLEAGQIHFSFLDFDAY